MFRFTIFLCVLVASAVAIPSGVAPVAYSASLLAPGIVTARSSQVIARNYNGVAAAPYVAGPAHYVAASPLRYTGGSFPSVSQGPATFAATPIKYTAYV